MKTTAKYEATDFTHVNPPVGTYPDPDLLIQEAMRWHFSEETGSQFWLDRRDKLGFNPITDVSTHADLFKFPDLTSDLREVPVEYLIPRGIRSEEVYGIYESGGTTGAPKRVICTRDWMRRWVHFSEEGFRARGHEPGGNWLAVMPTGPHIFGAALKEQAEHAGGHLLTIDMDPRWVKKLIASGNTEAAARYADHLIEQMTYLLSTQQCPFLVITPPLLVKAAEDDRLVELINEKVRYIQWGGAHMDADTRALFRTEVFPHITLQGGYGSTMVLGGSMERPGLAADEPCAFDSMAPFISFDVVNPGSRETVDYHTRGQVVMHLVSRGMLIPNNAERDTAVRVPARDGMPGDAVADIAPLATFDDARVIEGVY